MAIETNTAETVIERMALTGLSGNNDTRRTAVLVIDSEPMHRGHLRELIEAEGLEARAFSDAYEMLRHLERSPRVVKAVFIDSTIFAAVEKTILTAARSTHGMRLIVTGHNFDTGLVKELVGKGVHAFVRKPYSDMEISGFLH